jgi:hypothetical protein
MRLRLLIGAALLQLALASVAMAAKTATTAIPIEGMT